MATDLSAPLGLRERGKLDKRRRIVSASRSVFLDKGYDSATTREIAELAGVSVGTVFVYAQDKRELLLLGVNDELDALEMRGEAIVAGSGPFLDRLMAYYALRYRYWSREPRLARPVLAQTSDFLGPGAHDATEARRFFARRRFMTAQVERLVVHAQASGELARDLPCSRIAGLLVSLYLLEVRRWLHEPSPKVRSGTGRLRAAIEMVMRGIGAPP